MSYKSTDSAIHGHVSETIDSAMPKGAASSRGGMRKWVWKLVWGLAIPIVLLCALIIINVTLIPPAGDFDGYNFSSFRQKAQGTAVPPGLNPGDTFPADPDVYTLSGDRIKLA